MKADNVRHSEQLAAGLASIRDILGPGFTDHDIKSALWNYYFDQEQSIAYLLGGLRCAKDGRQPDGSHNVSACRAATKEHAKGE